MTYRAIETRRVAAVPSARKATHLVQETLGAFEQLKLERGRQASVQIFEVLREAIIDLSLPPGASLSRTELATRFRVSSTPLRDAFMRLAEEGLVDIFPQHGTVVSRIDLRKVHEAHFLRRAIELEVVGIVAKAPTKELIARLRDLLARQRAMHQLRDRRAFTEADQAFHRTLFEVANVPELWSLIRGQSGHLDRLRRLHLPSPGKADSIMAQHRAIIDAVAAGNLDKARDSMRKHLADTIANTDKIRKKFPQYIAV